MWPQNDPYKKWLDVYARQTMGYDNPYSGLNGFGPEARPGYAPGAYAPGAGYAPGAHNPEPPAFGAAISVPPAPAFPTSEPPVLEQPAQAASRPGAALREPVFVADWVRDEGPGPENRGWFRMLDALPYAEAAERGGGLAVMFRTLDKELPYIGREPLGIGRFIGIRAQPQDIEDAERHGVQPWELYARGIKKRACLIPLSAEEFLPETVPAAASSPQPIAAQTSVPGFLRREVEERLSPPRISGSNGPEPRVSRDFLGPGTTFPPAEPYPVLLAEPLSVPEHMVPWIMDASKETGVAPELIAAVIKVESRFDPYAENKDSGAYGLGQLMPKTATEVGVNRYDNAQNVLGCAKVLQKHLMQFKGNVQHALYAYNWGSGNLSNYFTLQKNPHAKVKGKRPTRISGQPRAHYREVMKYLGDLSDLDLEMKEMHINTP